MSTADMKKEFKQRLRQEPSDAAVIAIAMRSAIVAIAHTLELRPGCNLESVEQAITIAASQAAAEVITERHQAALDAVNRLV